MSKVCLTDITKLDGMSEWRILKFSDCIKQINTGLNPRKNFSLGHGKNRYITAKNLTKLGIIDFENCDCIDDRAKQIIHRRSDIQIGDILLSSRAPIGQCHLIKDEPSDYEIGESIFSIRVNKSIVRPDYFCLYLSSDFFVQLAAKNVTGSIIQEIRIGDLMNIDVIVPPMDVQEKIANGINMIDKKLILNNSICSDLESMAKLLYDYWFVQFDFPDENGRPYKSSGGKMVWNDELKREIPEGWRNGNLYDVADFVNGLACQKYRPKNVNDDKLRVIKITEMHEGFTENTEFVSSDVPKKYVIHDGNILFSWSASLEVMLWNNGKGCLNQHIFKVNSKKYGAHYVYMQLASYVINFVKLAEARKTTMGHITTDHLKQSQICLPESKVANLYEQKVLPLFTQITNLRQENQKLASLREFVLPMLMNGQIKIEDVRAS